jgi:Ca2+-binding EF-hand superfamily protein
MKNLLLKGAATMAFGLVVAQGVARAQKVQPDLPGPIDSLQDLQDTGKMLFKLADANNDGQISQKEATDAGNGLVGGFFFRADTNGDGIVTREELRAARQELLNEKPVLRMFAQQMRAERNAPGIHPVNAANTAPNTAPNAGRGVLSLVDTNNDGNIQANEVRQMVQTSVQSLYAAADTNRDGQLSPAEVNAAIVGAAKSVAQAAFQKADADGNGQLSEVEFDKAITEPAHAVFQAMDLNHDGQLSPQEAQAARRLVMSQLRRLSVPEPPNSVGNLIRSGQRPAEVAPVPNFGTARPAPAPPPGTAPRQP